MKDWQCFFEPHILYRGSEYYLENRVNHLEVRDQVCTAQVQGSEEYQVEIVMADAEVEHMYCSCPYARAGSNCKHMAAVLYALSEKEHDLLQADTTVHPSAEELVQSMSDRTVRRVLTELLEAHESLCKDIYMKYGDIPPAGLENLILAEIERITDTYSGCDDLVREEDTYSYAYDLSQLAEKRWKKLYDCKGPESVLRIVCRIIEAFETHTEEDPDDGIGILQDSIQSICGEMLSQCSMIQKEAAFSVLQQWIGSDQPEDSIVSMIKAWMHLFFREPEFAERRLEIVRMDLQQADDKMSDRMFEVLLTEKYLLLRQIPARAGELAEFRTVFLRYEFIRRAEIDALIAEEQWPEAISLLRESRKLDADNTSLVRTYTEQLIGIYERTHRTEELKGELLYHVRNCVQGSLSVLLRLKELVPEAEWISCRTEYLNRKWEPQRMRLMEHEQLWDELMDAAEAADLIDTLREFATVLQPRFPERFADCFVRQLRKKMEQRGTRGKYQSIMQDLKRLRSYPGCENTAIALAQEWRRQYPSRSAMLDELRNAGF